MTHINLLFQPIVDSMVTRYSDIETNSEVTDVLFCIVLGHNTVKGLTKILKQPQSTISTKLKFLLQNKVVTKSKWNFEPNWNRICQIMYKILKENSPLSLQLYVKSYIGKTFKIDDDKIKQLQKVVKNIKLYFPEERLRKMIEGYANLFIQTREKVSIQDIINKYFVGLIESNKDKLDRQLSELKEIMNEIPSKEMAFLKSVERLG